MLQKLIPQFIIDFGKYFIFLFLYKRLVKIQNIKNIGLSDILKKNIKLGNNVNLGIENYFTGKINIGDYTYINSPNSKLNAGDNSSINIGKFCSISWGVSIISKNEHNITLLTTNQNLYSEIKDIGKDINIGHDVWIGAGVIILPGITIGNSAIIGAGSVITKDVPDYAIVVGNPGKIIKYRFGENKIKMLQKLEWWNWDISKIKQEINKY